MSFNSNDERLAQAKDRNIQEVWVELGGGPINSSGKANAVFLGREERTPSVQVGGRKNIVTDYGGSGKIYNPIDLVMHVKGCTFAKALDFLVGPDDHHGGNGKPATSQKRSIKAVYDYCDELGNQLYQVVRYEPKEFSQRRRGEDGKWINNLEGVRRILYHLPDLLTAIHKSQQIYIVEGEKDADNLRKIDLAATTCAQGAGKWKPEYSDLLRGARVVILPDNDEPGRNHGEAVAKSLAGIATEVKVLELPGLKDKGDVSDWLGAGHTREEIEVLIAAAPVWVPKPNAVPTEKNTPRVSRTTDLANSARFIKQHGENVRYCYAQSSWMAWDGEVWSRDAEGAVMALAKQIPKTICEEAAKAGTTMEFEELIKHARASASRRAIADMMILSRNEVAIRQEQLDSEQWLLPLHNGTYDLREDRFREHHREDYFTRLAPVSFDGDADCPKFLAFLSKIMEGRDDVIAFLQRLFGVCLTGDVGCQKMFILWGGGQNGKTTLIETIKGVLGPFQTKIDTEILLAQKYSQHPTGLTDLYGTRLAWTSESGDGRKLAEDLVKSITGGDSIRARRMRENFFEWSPTHKLLLLTNNKPSIRGRDYAIWRRICLIPFTYKVPVDERVLNYENVLLEERSGILNWCIDGLRAYQEVGLSEPDTVKSSCGRVPA